jgi:rhodanese-related sulfurtransferase
MPRLFLHAILLLFAVTVHAAEVKRVDPAEGARLVAEGAVLVDVRELDEWKETGVVDGALLLPMSDFNADKKQWAPVLEDAKDRTLVLYCRSGNRSGRIAAQLAAQGYQVVNAGAFKDWKAAAQPVRKID